MHDGAFGRYRRIALESQPYAGVLVGCLLEEKEKEMKAWLWAPGTGFTSLRKLSLKS